MSTSDGETWIPVQNGFSSRIIASPFFGFVLSNQFKSNQFQFARAPEPLDRAGNGSIGTEGGRDIMTIDEYMKDSLLQ